MARKKTKAKVKATGIGKGNVHPLIVQAVGNGARLDRGKFEVSKVPNPYGEVMQGDEIRQHKAIRRVPRFETLYRSKVVDRTIFAVLEWYDERLARATGGLFKCALDTAGSGGGTPFTHVPAGVAAVQARDDVDWARGFIPADLLPVFDGVMEDQESFEAIGARVYSSLSLDRAKRKASSAFKLAANYLLLGVGHHVVGTAAA